MISSLLLAVLTAASPSAPVQSDLPAKCSLTVAFGSYAMGIDQPALARTEKLLRRDRSVTRVTSERHGREGETTLCAVTRRPADARRLFQRVKVALPRNPRGPVTVETRAGLRFTVSKPPR